MTRSRGRLIRRLVPVRLPRGVSACLTQSGLPGYQCAMRQLGFRVAALVTLGVWISQALLLFGLAVHVAEDHRGLLHASAADLGSALHGHDHAEGIPSHSHETLPPESAGATSKQARHLSLGVLCFVPRGAPASFADELVSGPAATQAAIKHRRISSARIDTGPPLHDVLCILLI